MAVRGHGQMAVSTFRPVQFFSNVATLVEVAIDTGKTHQIRVHLHHIGHPVFGDPTYGGRRIAWGGTEKKKKEEVQQFLKIINRQALHAKTLGFLHPVTKETLFFESNLPSDIQEILTQLRA